MVKGVFACIGGHFVYNALGIGLDTSVDSKNKADTTEELGGSCLDGPIIG